MAATHQHSRPEVLYSYKLSTSLNKDIVTLESRGDDLMLAWSINLSVVVEFHQDVSYLKLGLPKTLRRVNSMSIGVFLFLLFDIVSSRFEVID